MFIVKYNTYYISIILICIYLNIKLSTYLLFLVNVYLFYLMEQLNESYKFPQSRLFTILLILSIKHTELCKFLFIFLSFNQSRSRP